ncbi:MAG: hypothetical protein LBR70_03315 [Lactobacillaceae bacterium]|nr:hypothetical protein [Lactobacillaceae bacterium]
MEKSPVKFMWHYLKLFKWYTFGIAVMVFINILASRIFPLFLAKVYDAITRSDIDWQSIYVLLILAVVANFTSYTICSRKECC